MHIFSILIRHFLLIGLGFIATIGAVPIEQLLGTNVTSTTDETYSYVTNQTFASDNTNITFDLQIPEDISNIADLRDLIRVWTDVSKGVKAELEEIDIGYLVELIQEDYSTSEGDKLANNPEPESKVSSYINKGIKTAQIIMNNFGIRPIDWLENLLDKLDIPLNPVTLIRSIGYLN